MPADQHVEISLPADVRLMWTRWCRRFI